VERSNAATSPLLWFTFDQALGACFSPEDNHLFW
jgi:hypothetical protein